MKRPFGIKLTTALIAVVIVFHLVAAAASDLPRRWTVSHSLFAYSSTVFGVAVAGLALALLEALVLWFYWYGKNWARWVVLAGCLLCFVSLRHFIVGPPVSRGRTVILVYRMAAALVVMGYLYTEPVRAWFRDGLRAGGEES